jgi:hypothetical protein
MVRTMHRALFTLAFALLTGCASPKQHAADSQLLAPAPYVRISNVDSNHIQLQIAARKFLPPRRNEPVIWLTGVSHIGDTNYYAALQRHLDAQTLVLFEGVRGAAKESPPAAASPAREPAPDPAQESRGSFQSAMAASLGLVFQLQAIDYSADNFRNSDLSIPELRELMTQAESSSGQTGAAESFDNLVQMMDGGSWFDALLQLALRLLGANPKFQALGRLALIDLLGQIQGDPSRLGGLPPEMKDLLEVLLQRRNDKVVVDLQKHIPKMGRSDSIAVFYGTGHMPDLEAKLRKQLRYKPSGEIWFTSFDVDLARAQVSPSERDFVDQFVKWQLKEAGAADQPSR